MAIGLLSGFLALVIGLFVFTISNVSKNHQNKLPKNWKKVELNRISFYSPPNLIQQDVKGTDSSVWEYRGHDMILQIDLGRYSNNLQSYSEQSEYSEELTEIDGKAAKICTFEVGKNSSLNNKQKCQHIAAVHFPEIDNDFNTKLTFMVYCENADCRDIAKDIFYSIKFK